MRIEVSGHGVRVGAGLRAFAARRVQFALGRFEDRIARVSVRVRDINGPKGGLDHECRATVALRGGAEVVAGSLEPHAPLAMRTAVERLGRRLARLLSRRRDRDGRAFALGA